MTETDHDVVIVGGGPVGMGLAIELGQRGVKTCVVERYTEPQPIPKGQNLTQRTMEHFHFWGAEAELRDARTVPRGYDNGGMMCYGSLLSGYHYDWLSRGKVRQYYYTEAERLPQYATEAVLRARAAQIDCIDILYGWDGTDVTEANDQVTVTIRRHKGTETRSLTAQYVVGCDGSKSVVRQAAGITQTMDDRERLMALLVFRSPELHELLSANPPKSVYCALHPDLQGYWQFLGRVDLGTTWFFHAPVPLGSTAESYDFTALLHRAVGAEFPVEFEHIGLWELRIAVADQYAKGRCFVAGDAAHSHPPYGGYGINTGFEDARNLGWKLAATLQGWGGPDLLASYDAERRPVFISTARDFIENFIEEDREFLNTYDPAKDRALFEEKWNARNAAEHEVNAFEPHYEGSPLLLSDTGGHPGATGSHSFAARAGHHLAPQPLSDGRNLFEALGAGFTLLAFDADPADIAAFTGAADTLGVPLDVIRDSRGGGREAYGHRLILVRPDQFVAWVGDRVTDAAALLKLGVGEPPAPVA